MAEQRTFRLVIASVGDTFFDGAATEATLPGGAGVFTILPHHEAFVSILNKGEVVVRQTLGDPKRFPIESGVVEVSNNRAVVLL
jgi:F0F1-type ATP synthase epsilon subunit